MHLFALTAKVPVLNRDYEIMIDIKCIHMNKTFSYISQKCNLSIFGRDLVWIIYESIFL